MIANLLREVERLKKQLEWLKDSTDTGAVTIFVPYTEAVQCQAVVYCKCRSQF